MTMNFGNGERKEKGNIYLRHGGAEPKNPPPRLCFSLVSSYPHRNSREVTGGPVDIDSFSIEISSFYNWNILLETILFPGLKICPVHNQ